MESDMRAAVEFLWPDLPLEELSDQVIKSAQDRRAKDKIPPAKTIGALLPYTDFADAFEIISPRRGSLSTDAKLSIEHLSKSFDRLVTIRNQVAHTKPMRLDDAAFVADQATALVGLSPSVWTTLDETMRRIDDNPAYVLGLTPLWRAEEVSGTPFNNLPIPEFDETGFFGRREELKKLKKLVKGNYPIVSVLGTGGIGKTALTVEAAYELLDDPDRPFEAIVWVTAKSSVLTGTEIVSITNAIKDSLGLFSQAAEILGGSSGEDPIEDLKSYLETFKVLLILDNLETVLDPLLRDFLSDIPVGSKVIVTSRISLGMLDNPISLGALSPDDAINLLYALCRARGVKQLQDLSRLEVARYAEQMSGHPSYIRWFVAGLQANKRPEELLSDKGLILDFCMSNVYDYLEDQHRAALAAFQVLPSAKNMAELAYLNDATGEETERVLLTLLTTNFVSMSSRSTAGQPDSTYFLSDFAKEYLDRWHPVTRAQRSVLLTRNQELKDHGAQFSVEMVSSPYSATTITIRGVEDAYVARILKKALLQPVDEDAIRLCKEAQKLAPHHSEPYRVEGDIRSRMRDDSGAREAYERALSLSELASTRFHYASFLLDEGIEIVRALDLLQAAARIDPTSSEIASQIAWAQYLLQDWLLAIGAAKQVLDLLQSNFTQRVAAAVIILRSTCRQLGLQFSVEKSDQALELAEEVIGISEDLDPQILRGESADLLRFMHETIKSMLPQLKGFFKASAIKLMDRATQLILRIEPDSERLLSSINTLVHEKGYGFVNAEPEDYFLHVSQLIDSNIWDSLSAGEQCYFEAKLVNSRWRAANVRVIRL